jgi:hypothetical protein
MFSLSIAFEGPIVWALMFRNKDAAETAWKHLLETETFLAINDDFGQTCLVVKSRIAGAMLEDHSLSKLAHIERGLHNARTHAKMQQEAHNDPMLRTAAMAAGPAVLSPMNGPFPRN